jgi:hypothetical protein
VTNTDLNTDSHGLEIMKEIPTEVPIITAVGEDASFNRVLAMYRGAIMRLKRGSRRFIWR